MLLIRSISTRLALILAAAIGVGLGGCHAPSARAPRVRVRIATGTPGGGFYPLGGDPDHCEPLNRLAGGAR